ncbi:MAG: hypothetical protein ACLRFR_04340 [Clostridia bacterium]
MKRSIILNIFAWLEIIAFCAVNLYYMIGTKAPFPMWFSLGCFFIGLWQLLKAFYFNLDSSFWLGIALLGVASVRYLAYHGIIPAQYCAASYVLAFIFSSIITGIFYKKPAHFKISFILTLEDFLILLYSVNILNLLWFGIANAAIILLYVGGAICFHTKKTVIIKKKLKQK